MWCAKRARLLPNNAKKKQKIAEQKSRLLDYGKTSKIKWHIFFKLNCQQFYMEMFQKRRLGNIC